MGDEMKSDHYQQNFSDMVSIREHGQCRDKGLKHMSSQPALVNVKRFKFK
jgi:hypothetical protein